MRTVELVKHAVCVLFIRPGPKGPEVLAVSRKDDPLAVDIGLPGGKVIEYEQFNESLLASAMREAHEEVNFSGDSALDYTQVYTYWDNNYMTTVFLYTGKLKEPNCGFSVEGEGLVTWVTPSDLANLDNTFGKFNKALLERLGLL
jgi:8-oxo-dGTP pyrophosphatase MutT (NUDIX family)